MTAYNVIEAYAAVSGVMLGWELWTAQKQGRKEFAIFLTFIAFIGNPLICLYLLSMVS